MGPLHYTRLMTMEQRKRVRSRIRRSSPAIRLAIGCRTHERAVVLFKKLRPFGYRQWAPPARITALRAHIKLAIPKPIAIAEIVATSPGSMKL